MRSPGNQHTSVCWNKVTQESITHQYAGMV